jgi:hypothetical protein
MVLGLLCSVCVFAQVTLPTVAIHDSELTRALETMPASGSTPTGSGATGFQWWTTDWHYFVMPESLKEAFRSDGTPFATLSDANVSAGLLLSNGLPRYPIVFSLASEAIRDDEIAQFTNYVAAGGFLFVGSSSFTRNTNGTGRGDFAFANALGVHMAGSALTNWTNNSTFTKTNDHRIMNHIPSGQLTWRMPSDSEEIMWGTSPDHPFLAPHDVWRVQAGDATVLARGDNYPYLLVKQYGKGYFIYYAPMQPLIGHGGFAPSMYAYVMFRKAIEWAYETATLPIPRLSPWPYQYDAALIVRHDLENYQNEVAHIEASAGFEFTNGVKGDYYFCTGTLRVDMSPGGYNTNAVVQSLRRAISNYGATIGPHNGGLKNPNNPTLVGTNYDYWHWGTDEALDVTPAGYASGKAYATASLSNSFLNIESWLSGLMTPSMRIWCVPYFNGTREASYDLQAQLNVKINGEQKLTPFPHWTLSTQTSGKRYSHLSQPVSDWFVGGLVAQSLEPWHPPGVQTSATLHDAIDFYYNLGALLNFYSHTLSTGEGDAGPLEADYITYSMNTNFHPRLWSANGIGVYQWWVQRSNAQVTATCTTNGNQTTATFTISGSTSTNTTVELFLPSTNLFCNLLVLTNGVAANTNAYRTSLQTIKVRVGTSVTNVVVSYYPLAPATLLWSENFDTATRPGLPAGWTTSATGAQSPWITQNTTVDTAPNAAFAPDASNVGVSDLTSPVIAIPSGQATLTFRHNYNFEFGSANEVYDGGVLEIKIGSGGFTNVINAGVSFVSGGYVGTIDSGFSNPLAGSPAWGGNSGGFITTYLNLPQAASGQNIQLRWRSSSDNGNGGPGWRLDTISISNRACLCCGGNNAPVLPPQSTRTNLESVQLIVTNTATDFDQPPNNLAYVLVSPPAGATISSNGIITWTPDETQGPASYVLTTVVTDDGSPPMSATNSFTIVVVESNRPPVLPAQGSRNINELSPLMVTNTATDPDVPPNTLGYTLVTPPAGAQINSNGIITWTPDESQGPGSYNLTTVVSDNGSPALTATNSFLVTVNEVNTPPSLPVQTNRTINELTLLTVTNAASDSDLPANTLSYSLVGPPSGAQISSGGIITWTPDENQGPGAYTLTTVVTDNGSPPMSATNSFQVTVNETNNLPVLPVQANRTINELTLLTVTNTATDPDVPTNVLSYALVTPPSGAQIDTNGVITWTPDESQGPGTYNLKTVVSDNGTPVKTATNSFQVTVNEVNTAPILPPQTNLVVNELTLLIVTNTASDADLPANTLSYTLASPPVGAQINTNGVITWTPDESQGPGIYALTTVVTDNGAPALSATNSFQVTVDEVNTPPVLPPQTNLTVNEQTLLIVTNTASDSDLPANTLSYVLVSPPTGAQISTNGIINWTPDEGQGPGTYALTTVVTDNGSPAKSATNSFQVTVNEANTAPVLPGQTNRTVNEQSLLTVTNTAADSDLPVNVLSYTLVSPPTGAQISSNGIITWTPDESQGPGTYTFMTVVTDSGSPVMSATNSFQVTVNDVNSAPVLPLQTNRTINEQILLTVTNTAADTDLPANVLSYVLVSPPNGALISSNGVITWTPDESQGPGVYTLTTVVTDNGTPALSATNSFQVAVNEVNTAPVLPPQTNHTINEMTLLTVTNTASDSDLPANVLNYALVSPPSGAQISTNGVITWSPDESQGPGVYTLTTVVTDNGTPVLSATNSFQVTANEVNTAPVLPSQTNHTISELTLLTVTNMATDPDLPANILSYDLVSPPTGAHISNNGIITWTPDESQGPGIYILTTVVTDNGTPALSATNNFQVTVNEVNTAPTLPSQTNVVVNELTLLIVTNTATDSDLPANILSYTLVSPPSGAQISTNGIITWTPDESQGPGVYTLTTVVTDNGSPFGCATNGFQVTVNEVNTAPILPPQTNAVVNELTLLIVTNTATDSDLPANVLNYALINPPTGVQISTSGIITWTPEESQGPGVYTLTTVVTDNGTPALSASNSFQVSVNEVNTSPALPPQTNHTINELTLLTVTNTATDSDLPANILSYSLVSPPAGAQINTNGIITWTPDESQGPGVYTLTTVVTDNCAPAMSATNSFQVTVNEVNTSPILPLLTNVVVNELTLLTITNTAADSDLPLNDLGYALVTPPSGAQISTNGVITWTPDESQGPGVYTLTTVVTDNGAPALSATNSVQVTVNEVNTAPILPVQTNINVNELVQLTVTNTATDSDLPANSLSYALLNPPAGAQINTNGIITWTPDESQGPGSYVLMTVVTDDGIPAMSTTNSFKVQVGEVNSPPILPLQTNIAINELTLLTVTNSATDADEPANVLSYSLVNPPTGAQISSSGVISWTPDESQGPGSYTLTTVVTDDGVPVMGATNSFLVTVNEVNTAPILPSQTNVVVNELTLLTVTNTAADSDLPANSLNYALVSPPSGAQISTNGLITWTPDETQGPGIYLLTTVVTDDGVPAMSATNSFMVTVNDVNSAPILPLQTNLSVNELTLLTVTNTATDTDLPVNALSYALVDPPTGAQINSNGVITWTPDETQGPGAYTLTTVVTDDGIPAMSASNSFVVTVNEVNTAPVLGNTKDLVTDALSTLRVTNSATDADLPANVLNYALVSPPAGAAIDTNGLITWTPGPDQAPGTNVITTVVTDDGVPAMSATNTFIVVVTPQLVPPTITSIEVSNNVATVTWTTVTGHWYYLQYRDLPNGSWTDLGVETLANGSTATATDDVTNTPQRLYRVSTSHNDARLLH